MRGIVLLAALILGLATMAHADGSAGTATARELYTKATRAYNLQKFDQALTLFQQAYELKDDPAILYNIGQCQRQLGQFATAAKSYRAYLTQQPNAPGRGDVEQRIADMERQAKAQDEAEAAAQREREQQQALAQQATTAAAPQPVPLTVATAPRPRGSRTLKLAGIGVGAGGVALVVLGGVFAALSKSAGEDAYRGPVYDYNADDRQKSDRTAAIACFTLGGVALVAGATLLGLGVRH